MRTDVIVQHTLFKLVDGQSGLLSNLFETAPNQNGATDMIMGNTSQATLTGLNTRNLLGFAVKQLDFPAQCTHILSILGGILSHIVSSDKVRALGRERQPEELLKCEWATICAKKLGS